MFCLFSPWTSASCVYGVISWWHHCATLISRCTLLSSSSNWTSRITTVRLVSLQTHWRWSSFTLNVYMKRGRPPAVAETADAFAAALTTRNERAAVGARTHLQTYSACVWSVLTAVALAVRSTHRTRCTDARVRLFDRSLAGATLDRDYSGRLCVVYIAVGGFLIFQFSSSNCALR